MATVVTERLCAEVEGDFVVFLIGMRINNLLNVRGWLPVASAMPRMVGELRKRPELGLLHAYGMFTFPNLLSIQYWRSFEHLEAYARNPDAEHLPAWQAFQKATRDGDVGVWHETYLAKAGTYEAFYKDMPPWGLGLAGTRMPAKGHRKMARERLKATLGQG